MITADLISGKLRILLRALLVMVSACMSLGGPMSYAASPQGEAHLIDAMRRGGVVVLIRHSATDPGVGDPPGFRLADCSTQRNLSPAGLEQAQRIGEWFKSHGITPTSVRASPWCRTRETAKVAFGQSTDWPALSNIFGDRSREGEHAGRVREAVARVGEGALEVLVSHGVSINAFIDVYLSQGEMVVVRPARGAAGASDPGGIEVLGRMLVP